ncbi:MAG: hypothetical protein KJ666_14120 [Bacteroidetes bacterium]|nr:hypothetical protein [Bacteroidota bacterium]
MAPLKTESDFFFICGNQPARRTPVCRNASVCRHIQRVYTPKCYTLQELCIATFQHAGVLWQAGEISLPVILSGKRQAGGKYSPADYVPKFRDSQNRFLEIPSN